MGTVNPTLTLEPIEMERQSFSSAHRNPSTRPAAGPSGPVRYGHAHGAKNTLKSVVLLGGLGGLLVVIGSLFGRGGAFLGLFLGLAMVGGSYWFSDRLAIRAAHAVEVTPRQAPEYFEVVRDLTSRAGLPMPRLYISPEAQPNAFATGRNPDHAAVCVTEGILQVCSWDELRGVLAHELGHVGNRDILITSVAAAVATGISFLATMAQWGAMFGGMGGRSDDEERTNPLALLATALLAPLAAGLLQMALSRSREHEADRFGARLLGDGEPLARALEKIEAYAHRVPMDVQPAQAQAYIVNPLSGRNISFANLFRTHPETAERTRRLRSGEWRR